MPLQLVNWQVMLGPICFSCILLVVRKGLFIHACHTRRAAEEARRCWQNGRHNSCAAKQRGLVQFPLKGQCLQKKGRYTLHQQDAKAHVWATTVINLIKVVYLCNTALKIVSYTWVLQLGENGLPIARLPSKYKICSEENRITDGTMDSQRHYVQRDIAFYRLLYYISNKIQLYTVYVNWKLLYMFRVVPPPIIRSASRCTYSIWYLSHRYCYLPLSWKSVNWFECVVGGIPVQILPR
jgi:hypothetical protein